MDCAHCGHENLVGLASCSSCGSPLDQTDGSLASWIAANKPAAIGTAVGGLLFGVIGSLILSGALAGPKTTTKTNKPLTVSKPSKQLTSAEQKTLDQASALHREGMEAFHAWNKAKRASNHQVEEQKHAEATKKLEAARDTFSRALAKHRRANGMLEQGFEGYDSTYSSIAKCLIDLEKGARVR